MKLTERMQGIANLVTPGLVVADIGTDHSYLPIYLVKNKICPGAVAMDVNKGPLKIARGNIESEKLEGSIKTRLSDGLTNLQPKEAQSVIIAGMGGRLILKILWDSRDKWKEISEFILQPQSELVLFRRQMEAWGFQCVKEDMILEDGKYYPMGRYVSPYEENRRPHLEEAVDINGPEQWETLEELTTEIPAEKRIVYRYGEELLNRKHPVLKEYLEKEKRHLHKLYEALEASADKEGQKKRQKELQFKLEDNKRACQYMETEGR